MNTDIFWLDLDTWQSHLTSCSGINGINNPRSRSLISRCSFIWAYIKVIWKSNRMQSICIVHMRHMHIISSQPNLSTQATDRSSRKIPKDRKHVAEDHLLLLKKRAHFHVAVRPSLPSSHAFRLRHCETACEDYQHVRSKLHMIYISGKKTHFGLWLWLFSIFCLWSLPCLTLLDSQNVRSNRNPGTTRILCFQGIVPVS